MYKYKKCHSEILQNLKNHPVDLYLLCDIDLPWQPDPLREHPDKRKFLFDKYYEELTLMNANFEVVTGLGDQRFENAKNLINKTFK